MEGSGSANRAASLSVPSHASRLGADDLVLFRGASIITMDATLGDFPVGDLLIGNGQVLGVGADLSEALSRNPVVVDSSGYILAPGFHDTHRHCWQGVLRRLIPNVDDNESYIRIAHELLAPVYTPADMYQGNRLSALGAIDAGITSIMDFSHNSRTDEHADAAIHGLADTGIRATHANCAPVVGDFSHRWPHDLQRLSETVDGLGHDRVTLRVGALCMESIGGPDIALTAELIRFARDHSLGVSVDAVLGAESSLVVEVLGGSGMLGPDILLIHCSGLSDTAWRHISETNTRISLAPTSDASIGIAASIPPIQDALDAGVEPSLSIDVEIALSNDMFTQMRTVLNTQRMMAFNQRYRSTPGGAVHGFEALGIHDFPSAISARDVLRYATINGATAHGLGSFTGSLTPGKQADVIVCDAQAINNLPLNNALGTLVNGCDARNITAVFVDGHPLKWCGSLIGVDVSTILVEVVESRDRLMADAGIPFDALAD